DEVATLAAAIDPRYRALVLLAAYSGLRAGELAALRRKHVDLLRRSVTVVEQVQRIGGRFVVLPPKSAAGRRSVALPMLVAPAMARPRSRSTGTATSCPARSAVWPTGWMRWPAGPCPPRALPSRRSGADRTADGEGALMDRPRPLATLAADVAQVDETGYVWT